MGDRREEGEGRGSTDETLFGVKVELRRGAKVARSKYQRIAT